MEEEQWILREMEGEEMKEVEGREAVGCIVSE